MDADSVVAVSLQKLLDAHCLSSRREEEENIHYNKILSIRSLQLRLKEIDVDLIERYGYVIRSCGTICKGSKPLGSSPNTTGYLKVMLDVANKKGTFLVHRLVAAKHVPKVEGKLFVNHKDGNRLNNAADNLEWCTSSENMHNAYGVTDGKQLAKQMREQGKTYKEIGVRLSVSMVTARNWANNVDTASVKREQRERAKARGTLRYVDGLARHN